MALTGQGSNFQYRLGRQLLRLIFLVVFLTFPGKFSVLNFDLSISLSCSSEFTVRNHSSLLFEIKNGWLDDWMYGWLFNGAVSKVQPLHIVI